MKNIYEYIEEHNPNKKSKILIVFDMIADMLSNKQLNSNLLNHLLEVEKYTFILLLLTNLILL